MTEHKQLQLAIEGMHCDACVNRVTKALGKVDGVQVRKVIVGSAEVAFDPQVTSPEQITGAVDRIGFTARVGRD